VRGTRRRVLSVLETRKVRRYGRGIFEGALFRKQEATSESAAPDCLSESLYIREQQDLCKILAVIEEWRGYYY